MLLLEIVVFMLSGIAAGTSIALYLARKKRDARLMQCGACGIHYLCSCHPNSECNEAPPIV